jgi:hypothetical protein
MITLTEIRNRAIVFQKEWEENFHKVIGLKVL